MFKVLKMITILMTFVKVNNQHLDTHLIDLTTTKRSTDIFISQELSATFDLTTMNISLLADDVHSGISQGEHRAVELLINIGGLLFIVSLLYGVIKGQPKFILPYFCLQVFDFCLSSLIIIGFFTYNTNIKLWIASKNWFPLKDQLLTLNNGWLVLIAGCVAVCVLWLKAYCINIVWSCYKYLISFRNTAPINGAASFMVDTEFYVSSRVLEGEDIECMRQDGIVVAVTSGRDNEIVLPPKYEDVLQMSGDECAPDYDTHSTSSLPPAYNEVAPAANPSRLN